MIVPKPPVVVTFIAPLHALLQFAFVAVAEVYTIGVEPATFTFVVIVQPFASVTVTKYVAGPNPDNVNGLAAGPTEIAPDVAEYKAVPPVIFKVIVPFA